MTDDRTDDEQPDLSKLPGCWVEIREESTADRIVLRPDSADIPPARGRRQIDLIPPSELLVGHPGPTDATATRSGTWSAEGDELTLDGPGWAGCYGIAQLGEDILVIRKRS
ncbi:hypothetical protein [Millisia brevis]|uniref:hypothetical protein n=1 Tax=Millisia brevis TaxID=264148 RepID=UPI000833ABFD|nr:hypothetical protein [Millisia brevis]